MVAPFVQHARSRRLGGDVDILNFALTLEYLEAAFYKKATGLKLSGQAAQARQGVRRPRAAARRRAEAGDQVARRQAGQEPDASRSAITDEASFLKLAHTLEDTGVSAYNGAAPAIKSKDILAAAGSIVQVEARHAAAIRLLRGQPPAPEAFDRTLDKAAVLKAVKPLIKS